MPRASRAAVPALAACLAAAAFVWPTLGDGPLNAPLDDAYIHLQYGRSIAEGHPFAYHAGDAPSSGASSPAYAFLLALFFLLGAEGHGAYLVSLLSGVAFYAAAAALLVALARRRAPITVAPVLLVLVGWGWLVWHMASGMEGALALLALAGVLLAADRWIAEPPRRTHRGAAVFVVVAILLPLIRPAAVAFSGAIFLMLALFPPPGGRARRAWALPVLLSLGVSRAFWRVATGQAYPNGALAKWLPLNPVLGPDDVAQMMARHRAGLGSFLFGWGDGHPAGYVPPLVGGAVIVVGLAAVILRPWRGGETLVRAAFAGAPVLALLALTSYGTFDTHHFRYLMPYAAVLFATTTIEASRRLTDLGRRVPSLRGFAVLLPMLVGVSFPLATFLPARASYESAVTEIGEQHMRLVGAIRRLPEGAIVGVTDAGAFAYFGGHRTVDIVGLTTNGAAPAFVAGSGGRLEWLESLPAAERPDYIATYANRIWFDGLHMLGAQVAEAVTTRRPPTIAGGVRLVLWRARYPTLDVGEAPSSGTPFDGVDVLDLADEAAHGYESPSRGTIRHDAALPGGGPLASEGGSRVTTRESMRLRARPGADCRLVGRLAAAEPGQATVELNGEPVGRIALAPGPWRELSLPLPRVRAENAIVVRPGATTSHYDAFHWWMVCE